MFGVKLLFIFSVFIVCDFCGKDFISIGRHSWRCKSRGKTASNEQDNDTPQAPPETLAENPVVPSEQTAPVTKTTDVHCRFGRVCRGIRGLRMHQNSCRVLKDLELELAEPDPA